MWSHYLEIKKIIMNKKFATKAYVDDLILYSAVHPRPPFLKRIWNMVKAIFVRPKFSAESLEPALREDWFSFRDRMVLEGELEIGRNCWIASDYFMHTAMPKYLGERNEKEV